LSVLCVDADAQCNQPPSSLPIEYTSFSLPILYDKNKTGLPLQEKKHLNVGDVIAGRYQVQRQLGEAAFSVVYQCLDLLGAASEGTEHPREVCLKMIKNDANENFNQSLDEIKMLRYLNTRQAMNERKATNERNGMANSAVLTLYDYFYTQEHLFIVTELLGMNLYELNNTTETNGVDIVLLSKMTKEIVLSLHFLHHELKVIHCDLKPENICLDAKTNSVKVIDYGSTCFVTDRKELYIQSRTYRAPEVVLGMQ